MAETFFLLDESKGWREHLSPNQLIQSVFNYINRPVFLLLLVAERLVVRPSKQLLSYKSLLPYLISSTSHTEKKKPPSPAND